ncbi:eukaryotic translation initiation factor 2 subunit alpha [Theileria orientalis strain Shintoku]|uniref:Eukaryotic translation initiation factor 2 subunit alpha n=1 Tax=Theileria orientalis strain Shintoku TaxID=869250 RepID=J4C7N4_THEOR|nr:eukaryotic translation initiation factor 2 subunit alpha [Theileria orientalis strain Shintoku]BAM39343.1 eukaryotic translation initiation factor 2 subunit alpha [Theileria orientalis strain Shintoku]|eukprot:XP_009689644.1 eukaryotic translation initiation factor 2 subunit alpha [Theileria orientalis strain Shintoku]
MPPVSKSNLGDCRFYERKFPEPEELVMVKVNRIEAQGVYVSLLEYDDREGLILLNELSKRRYRSINKLVKIGRHEVVLVLRVDPVKGYIDLSKRRVTPEDIIKCEERFSKSKKVHQTVRHIAQKHGVSVEELNRACIWPLYKTYPHALDALKEAAANKENVFKNLTLSQEIVDSLLQDIQLRLVPQALKLRCSIDVWCFGPEGINAVKTSLTKAKEVDPQVRKSSDQFSAFDKQLRISIRLIAPPQYEIITSCFDKEAGLNTMNQTLEVIETNIRSFIGGDFKQKCEVVVIGDDEKHLEDLLEQHESTDEEDEEEEEEEDEGMGRVDESMLPPNEENLEEDSD